MGTATEAPEQPTVVQPAVPPYQPAHRDRPPRRPPLPGPAVAVIRISIGSALLALWVVFFALGLAGFEAARSQLVLYSQLRTQLADATEPIGGPIDPGTPVALIEAQRIDLRYVVVEGTAAGDLRAGPGHRRDTPLPGQAGTCVLYGRATGFGGPFRHILDLRPGDTITVTTGQGTFGYRVDGVRRAGDPLPGLLPSGGGRLTLVTAEGVSWRAGWAPNRVAYVDATLQGTPQPAPAGRLTGVPKADLAMQGDPDALVPVVLWLQLLILGGVGAAWAQRRWGGAQAWLVFTPVILATLWGASESAIQLLPNLM
ncbi:MAG: hypothetical protein AUI14_08665 [Actinobacteria bacterium 13_2_20CM_2_71_6]|nr:MAG: hypothetical protein AUI14_08665 [Actinobacteria bacterium 13_2_20CM_2_71_6]